MSFAPPDYLRHILAETEYLIAASDTVTKSHFLADTTLQRAFVRSLEIIGEAVKKLPDDFRRDHAEIEWRQMAKMRDRLIHGYFSVDYDLVWEVVQTRIPELHRKVALILSRGA